MLNPLKVPESLDFATLELERELVTRRLMFKPAPLAELCRMNGEDPERILIDEDLAMWFIAEWYCAHRMAGVDPDTVAEQILAEVAELIADGNPEVVSVASGPN